MSRAIQGDAKGSRPIDRIIGKTIAGVELLTRDCSMLFMFQDGTKFYVLAESKPCIDTLFAWSPKDDDQVEEVFEKEE